MRTQNLSAITFALAGLYLLIEKGYSGRRVQQMHMQMAENKKVWPTINLPKLRGEITISEVLASPPGEKRDEMIKKWCSSVWQA